MAGRLIKEWQKQDQWIGIGRSKEPAIQGISYIQADLSDHKELFGRVKESCGKADLVIHSAAMLCGDAKSLYQANCLGTLHLVELVKELGCRQFVYISSVPVIGAPMQIPVTEEHPVHPKTVYHQTKYLGELITEQLAAEGVSYLILRIPSPVGFGMPAEKIFSVFVKKAASGGTLTVYGDGQRIQSYLDIRDLVRAVQLGIGKGLKGTYQIVGNGVCDEELARRCLAYYGRREQIQFCRDGYKNAAEKWILSGWKAKKDFGYEPAYTLEDSIAYVAGQTFAKEGSE